MKHAACLHAMICATAPFTCSSSHPTLVHRRATATPEQRADAVLFSKARNGRSSACHDRRRRRDNQQSGLGHPGLRRAASRMGSTQWRLPAGPPPATSHHGARPCNGRIPLLGPRALHAQSLWLQSPAPHRVDQCHQMGDRETPLIPRRSETAALAFAAVGPADAARCSGAALDSRAS